ncbi:hypothetical protein OIU76_017562, partial [Salix suchowensis]
MFAGNPCESQSCDCDSSAFAEATENRFFQNSPPAPPSPPPPPPPPPPTQLPPPNQSPPPLSMTGDNRRKIVATAAVPEKVRALRREFWRFCCLVSEWGLGFCGEAKEGGEKRSHLMVEARELRVARCFLLEEKMAVLRGALVTRLVDAEKDMAFGRRIGREHQRIDYNNGLLTASLKREVARDEIWSDGNTINYHGDVYIHCSLARSLYVIPYEFRGSEMGKEKSYRERQERRAFFEKSSISTCKDDIVVFCNKSLVDMVTIINPSKNQLLSDTSVKGSSSDSKKEVQEEEYKVLTAVKSQYNDILIVDTPKTRMLLLDSTHNVHSLLYKDGQKWTRSYWDEFASLPAIIPQGPVAIFGLGGGTAAHLMLDVWPSLQLEGWEIDEILINKARDYFGLSDLEKQTQAGGILHVVVGDALCSLEDDSRKYAGIVIDLFYGGKVLPQLQDV